MSLRFPQLTKLPVERYSTLLSGDSMGWLLERIDALRAQLSGRVVWNVSSTAIGGGVAEMVRSLLAYARGAGVDARWAVIEGSPTFFALTKRIHHALHGSAGDGSSIGDAERRLYEQVNATNAAELCPLLRRGDVVIVHDPQPAGMVAALVARGARVVWRCHVGADAADNPHVAVGWRFLAPYLQDAHCYVFSRSAYIPVRHIDASRAVVIPPTIDPFSAKNQPLTKACCLAILQQAGLVESSPTCGAMFTREDGTPGRVDRPADIVRDGLAPTATTPLVVQVSRWDPLKDPIGVMEGFARVPEAAARGAHLVLAGPNTSGVSDDLEAPAVLADVTAQWRRLPDDVRRRVHLASIPTFDVDENAAIVNALQRHATVIVQKSLHEGFGLTVTEAMWKAKPVIASAVGGIQDQIVDGEDGVLLADPTDRGECAAALERVLGDPERALRMGERAHAAVLDGRLGIDSLLRYGALLEWLFHDGVVHARPDLEHVRLY